MVALPLTIGLLLLLIWHVQLIMVNKTTIEYQEVGARGCGTGACVAGGCVAEGPRVLGRPSPPPQSVHTRAHARARPRATVHYRPHATLARSPAFLRRPTQGVTANVTAAASGIVVAAAASFQHPYDLGLYQNMMTIFGSNPAAWLLPPLRPTSGGTSYPTKWDEGRADDGEHEARLLGF